VVSLVRSSGDHGSSTRATPPVVTDAVGKSTNSVAPHDASATAQTNPSDDRLPGPVALCLPGRVHGMWFPESLAGEGYR
jgi:hypothetical protein